MQPSPRPPFRGSIHSSPYTPVPPPQSTSRRSPNSATPTITLPNATPPNVDDPLHHPYGAQQNPSGAPTLEELDRARSRAAAEGRFADAQAALEAIRQATESKGLELEEAVGAYRDTKYDTILETQRVQLLEFTVSWERVMKEYEQKSMAAIGALRDTHASFLHDQEALLRSELNARPIHYSRRVLNMRDALQRLSTSLHYKEAEEVQKMLLPMEREELRRFDEKLSVEFAAMSKRWRERCRKEMSTLKQKIDNGRGQLLEQRRRDYDAMILKHFNMAKEQEQKTKTKLARAKESLRRQMRSFHSDPRRTRVHFDDFTNLVGEVS
eukprot:PhF_6_TR38155/c0_g1_i1/m.57000